MATTESPNIDQNTGSVRYTRKVQVRPYEVAEASITVSFDIPNDPDMTDEARSSQLIANARASFFSAKALVFEELGLEFIVGDSGIVTEVVERHFGSVSEVQATPPATEAVSELHGAPAPAAAPSGDAGANPPFSPSTTDKAEKGQNSTWAKQRYAMYPNEFFDNRPKKASGEYKSNAPDLKHKDTKIGVWL
jgi:hypothetical protein